MAIPVVSEMIAILLQHPFLSYVLIIFLFTADSLLASSLNFSGISGFIVNEVFKFLFKVDVGFTSWQILVLIILIPLGIIAWNKSKQP